MLELFIRKDKLKGLSMKLNSLFLFLIFFFSFFTTNFLCCSSSLLSFSSTDKIAYSNLSITLKPETKFEVYSPNTTVFFLNTFDKPTDSITVFRDPNINTRLGAYKKGNFTIIFISKNFNYTTTSVFNFPKTINNGFNQKDIELIIMVVICIIGVYYFVQKSKY